MLSNIGSTEIFIIALVLFFMFGGKKLHEWARGIGDAGREVNKVKKEFQEGLNGDVEETSIDDNVAEVSMKASEPVIEKKNNGTETKKKKGVV